MQLLIKSSYCIVPNSPTPLKKERRWLIIDNFNHITNEVVETMSSTVSGGHRLFLIASHDEFNSPSISMHSKVSYIRYVGDLLTFLLLSFISILWLRKFFGQMLVGTWVIQIGQERIVVFFQVKVAKLLLSKVGIS